MNNDPFNLFYGQRAPHEPMPARARGAPESDRPEHSDIVIALMVAAVVGACSGGALVLVVLAVVR